VTESRPVTRWQRATVREIRKLSPRLVALRLQIDDRIDHWPGQHYVVRLTAPDGYTASRSYSIASSPAEELLELCVERLVDGEVSGYLYDIVEVGDELEVRVPIGGWFVWDGCTPAALVGGGTGVVPLISMVRHAIDLDRRELLSVAASGRSREEMPYLDDLIDFGATVSLTAASPAEGILEHRLTAAELRPLLDSAKVAYVCGSARFAEAMSALLVEQGFPSSDVRVERFGPTG